MKTAPGESLEKTDDLYLGNYLSDGMFQGYSEHFQNSVATMNREQSLFSSETAVIKGSITVSF